MSVYCAVLIMGLACILSFAAAWVVGCYLLLGEFRWASFVDLVDCLFGFYIDLF